MDFLKECMVEQVSRMECTAERMFQTECTAEQMFRMETLVMHLNITLLNDDNWN